MCFDLPYIINDYVLREEIGFGGFSRVYKIESKKFQKEFVAKVIHLPNVDKANSHWETFDAEVKALMTLDHPHIIRLYDHFHVDSDFFIILEYCSKGSLQNELNSKRKGLDIDRFKTLSKQIVEGIAYCHSKNIAHHDIKPQNVLIDPFGKAKIADFGLCLVVQEGNLSENYAGSIMYSAPEIFQKKPHNPYCSDMWALGVMFVMMISGESPWRTNVTERMKELASVGAYQISENVSPQILSIIRKLIIVDPSKRISAADLLKEPFFSESIPRPLTPVSKDPTDPLSPRGRRILSPVTKRHSQNMSPVSYSQSTSQLKESQDIQPKAVLIGYNCCFGPNRPAKTKKRLSQLDYHKPIETFPQKIVL